MMNSLTDFILSPFTKTKGVARAQIMRVMINWLVLTCMPSRISQEVTVVPMLAPITTAMAPARERSPELTKLTTITVVAVEDWMAAVTAAPVMMPRKGWLVIRPMMLGILFPATFCSPWLISFMA